MPETTKEAGPNGQKRMDYPSKEMHFVLEPHHENFSNKIVFVYYYCSNALKI